MKFRLIYNGEIPSTGNKSRPNDVARIRLAFHEQLKELWKTHPALATLENSAYRQIPYGNTIVDASLVTNKDKWQRNPSGYDQLVTMIDVGNKKYKPLVRLSLHLSSELTILFLSKDDPRALITQSGDIDGRIKTLLDALRMPTEQEQGATKEANLPHDEYTCLLESDTLITRLYIEKDRLLFPKTTRPHECHLIVEVTLNVLEVHDYNVCLL